MAGRMWGGRRPALIDHDDDIHDHDDHHDDRAANNDVNDDNHDEALYDHNHDEHDQAVIDYHDDDDNDHYDQAVHHHHDDDHHNGAAGELREHRLATNVLLVQVLPFAEHPQRRVQLRVRPQREQQSQQSVLSEADGRVYSDQLVRLCDSSGHIKSHRPFGWPAVVVRFGG